MDSESAIDPALCFENEIRKAQINKESLIAVLCCNVEKAYGIKGNMYNWVKNLLMDRLIVVRIGKEYSNKYVVQNGTPQGCIVSLVLFSVVINEVFSSVDKSTGVAVFA